MSVQGRVHSFEALHRLKTHPLATLQQHTLAVGLQPGHQTIDGDVPFLFANGIVSIGPGNAHNPDAVSMKALATPTRGANSPNRFTAMLRFAAHTKDFWITERQTGCSLIILDWGGGQMSMGHMLPYPFAAYNTVNQFLMNHAPLTVFAEAQRQSLKPEVTQLVNASKVGGVEPLRYILVQSNHAYINQRSLNVIGVRHNGRMTFFMQTIAGGANLTAQQLEWTDWYRYRPYLTY